MRYSHRFWLYAPITVFLLLLAGVGLHWWSVYGALSRKLDALNGHEAMPGVTISFAGKSISGFPFNIDVVFQDFRVEGTGAHGPFRWRSEKFALHRLTYGRSQDIYEAGGAQSLSWTDADGKSHRLQFLPGSLRASAITDRQGLARFDLEAVDAGGNDTAGTPFTAAHLQFHLRRDPAGDGLDLMASGDQIASRDGMGLFGDRIKSLRLYATLTHRAAWAPLLAGTGTWAAASTTWHAQSGQVLIGPVAIVSSGVNLTADRFADRDSELGSVLNPLY